MAEKRKLWCSFQLDGRLVPGGVIGNTRDFDSLILGSSPSRVTCLLLSRWVLPAVLVECHGGCSGNVVAKG